MKRSGFHRWLFPMLCLFLVAALPSGAGAVAFVQCPEDTDRDGIPDIDLPGIQCKHLTGGDGFIGMADGRDMYTFGFSDVTNIPQDQVLNVGVLRQQMPAPPIATREGERLYLTLTNVGTFIRPDLFDPHTVHYHGFPNASAIFDGLPESAIAINQQASLTYFYLNIFPGTYMYHCHVEATEHMQMGMLGSLHVKPMQDLLPGGRNLGGHIHFNDGDANILPLSNFPGPEDVDLNGNGVFDEGNHDKYAYNDRDGSTRYDVEYAIQIAAFDHNFHDASFNTQPLPFAAMIDTYPMMNGRGYPDTANPNPLASPPDSTAPSAQPESSLITANQGERILLRLINLGVVRQYTVTALGLPMTVVGRGARLLRGPGQGPRQNIFVRTNTVTLGGGESADIIIDTADVAPGTYFLYTTNLNYLSNNEEDFGGLMTEIVIN